MVLEGSGAYGNLADGGGTNGGGAYANGAGGDEAGGDEAYGLGESGDSVENDMIATIKRKYSEMSELDEQIRQLEELKSRRGAISENIRGLLARI